MPTVTMPDGTKVEMPDNPSPELLGRLESFRKSQPIQQKTAQLPLSASDVAKGFVANIPSSALSAAKSIGTTIAHPLKTAEAIGDIAAGGIEKAVGAELQPEAKSFDALTGMLKNRYGSIENTKKTIATDPVGFMMDLSTVLGGTGSLLKTAGKVGDISSLAKTGEVVGEIGNAVNPISLAGVVARGATKAVASTGLPERLYGSAVKFSTTLKPEARAARIKTGIIERIVPSKEGLSKLRDTVEGVNNEIKGIINNASKTGDTLKADEIITRLDDLKSFYSNAAAPQNFIDDIDKLAEQFKGFHGESIPVETAQKIKQTTYQIIRKHYGELKSVSIEGQKAIARGIKEELVLKYPELAKLNARESSLLSLEESIVKAVSRLENRDMIGIGSTIATTAGTAATGVPHAGLLTGIGRALWDHPKVKSRIAFALQTARNKALIQSQSKIATGGLAAFQASRMSEQSPQ